MTSATTKADRYSNRAPKGGAISPVNGVFYRGGQFMPMVAEVVEARPAPLSGSVRQVAWANRLRAQALVSLEDEINARLLFLASPVRREAAENRKAVRRFLAEKHALMTERSAARVIEMRNREGLE